MCLELVLNRPIWFHYDIIMTFFIIECEQWLPFDSQVETMKKYKIAIEIGSIKLRWLLLCAWFACGNYERYLANNYNNNDGNVLDIWY